jgi:hypothetical protein
MKNETIIGKLTATIDGDDRYTDRLEVVHDEETGQIVVVVVSSTPRGGMDGDPTALYRSHLEAVLGKGCLAKDVLKAVKSVIQKDCYNFKRYGKPTKRFCWLVCNPSLRGLTCDKYIQGLNVGLVSDALQEVRGR